MEGGQEKVASQVQSYKATSYGMVGICMVLPILYWFGVIGTGPLEWLQAIGVVQKPAFADGSPGLESMFSDMNQATLWLFGGIMWMGVSLLALTPFKVRIYRKVLGSMEAVDAARNQIYLQESTPIPHGELVNVTINRGGFLSSANSLIETTKSFHRVFGQVSGIDKGSVVDELQGRLRIHQLDGSLKEYVILK